MCCSGVSSCVSNVTGESGAVQSFFYEDNILALPGIHLIDMAAIGRYYSHIYSLFSFDEVVSYHSNCRCCVATDTIWCLLAVQSAAERSK